MKKTKQMLITASLLLCANFAAAETIEYGGLMYSINTNAKTAKVVEKGNYQHYTDVSIDVPETIEYNGETYTVTALGDGCFQVCPNLVSVTIPKTVTSIGSMTFNTCENLKSVKFADGINVKALPNAVFNSCYKLTDVTIPQSVTSLGQYCFDECSSLTSIVIPDGVKSIDESCFARCHSLKSIKVPENVTYLGSSCFASCENLESVELPSGYEGSLDGTFSGCTSLTSVKIPFGVTYLSDYTFSGCSSLTSLEIPSGVKYLGTNCFKGCTSLTSLNIPSGVTQISTECFSGCTSLTSIELPYGLQALGGDSFAGCPSISVTMHSLPYGFKSRYETQNYKAGFESTANVALALNDDSYIYVEDENSYEKYKLATDDATFSTVSYSRPSTTKWSTVVVPFDATLKGNESYKLYCIQGWTDGQDVVLKHVDDNIKAGVSYVVYNNGDQLDINAENVSGVTNKLQGIYLTGTYKSKNINSGYFLNGDKFWSVDYVMSQYPDEAKGVTVPPFRAYVSTTSSSNAPSLSLSVDGETTGINAAELTDALNDGAEYFDLSGKRLQAPQRGVNIVRTASGKTVKMVIK